MFPKEFNNLHPQIKCTAKYIYNRESKKENETEEQFIKRVIIIAQKHCKNKYGIKYDTSS